MGFDEATLKRFWSKVDRSGGPDACWPWTASINADGYGRFRVCFETLPAHRLAALISGLLPRYKDIRLVCHRCDNRSCCNPSHLFLGSNNDNMKDMKRKGRAARGERSALAKLTEQDVVAIRKLANDGHAYKEIAFQYNISQSTVWQLKMRHRWKHVP